MQPLTVFFFFYVITGVKKYDSHPSYPVNTLLQIKKYLGKFNFLAHNKFNMNALIKTLSSLKEAVIPQYKRCDWQ